METLPGYLTESQIRNILETKSNRTWEEFHKWMIGQTIVILNDGTYLYPGSDLYRFLNNQPIID